MSDEVDGFSAGPWEGGGPPLDNTTTTLTTRRWIAREVAGARDLLLHHNGAATLPPEVAEFARGQMGREGWPLWLVHGIGAALFRQWLKEQLRPEQETPADRARTASQQSLATPSRLPVEPPAGSATTPKKGRRR